MVSSTVNKHLELTAIFHSFQLLNFCESVTSAHLLCFILDYGYYFYFIEFNIWTIQRLTSDLVDIIILER